MSDPNRRAFLGGAALLAIPALVENCGEGTAVGKSADERVAELIALSRDQHGKPHVARVAFLTPERTSGTLPVSAAEAADLRAVLASGDFKLFQERGLRFDNKKFVYIRESEEGTVVHAVRRGEFVTIRKARSELVVATSVDGMAHPRAVEAVYQYVQRSAAIA
ncbi:MAG: profilin family protein [Polyangiaceae bacterium]|nr:profilin family protein [Polyangiaceae bacterium]